MKAWLKMKGVGGGATFANAPSRLPLLTVHQLNAPGAFIKKIIRQLSYIFIIYYMLYYTFFINVHYIHVTSYMLYIIYKHYMTYSIKFGLSDFFLTENVKKAQAG